MAFTGLELTEAGGGGMNTGISQEEGSAEATYRMYGTDENTPPTVSVVGEVFDYFNGGVANIEPKTVARGTAGAGKVVRVLPPVHPFRPELSAAGVTSMVGVGKQTTGTSVQVFGLTPVTGQFPHFTQYDYRVKFQKRPYFLLPDEKIEVKGGLSYTPPTGSPLPFYYAEEWRRFTSFTRAPLPDTVNATFGQMTFKTASTADPDGFQYANQVYMSLQNSLVEYTWYQVPFRYFLNFGSQLSYLTRFMNCVNQHPWNGYAAGTLLYLGATPTSYVPSTPKRQRLLNALVVGLDQNLLCNVKLRFLHTSREGTDVPASSGNNIKAGHNLQPNFADRKFYYTESEAGSASFQSFPFQLFWTDPMLEQPGGPI